MITAGQQYRTREAIPVVCVWWYDTVAILADYSDTCEATLPAGKSFTVREVGAGPKEGRVLCELHGAEDLKARLIPEGRQIRSFWCKPTEYCVELSAADFASKCDLLA
jgi:hypothetical protein